MPTDSKRSGRARSPRTATKSKSRGAQSAQNGRVKPTDVARSAARLLSELSGRRVESVLGLRKDDDGWKVMLEVVELSRVPNSTDLLGSYVVSVDDHGELLGYERVRRYQRGQTAGDER